MSLSSGLIAVVALAYMAIMFAIAFYGDRRSAPLPPRVRAWVYSLSLAVYCTSWTFFGAVARRPSSSGPSCRSTSGRSCCCLVRRGSCRKW